MAAASSLSSFAPALGTPVGDQVYCGLTATPKTLSPWLFYDARGSQLFEQITELPEYYVTRTERALFCSHADEILALAAGGTHEASRRLAAIELGAGTASKTGVLLASAVRRQGAVDYYAIDVSASALAEAKANLERQLAGVRVHTRVADYTEGLGQIDADGARRLVLYIGSSIGNFEPGAAADLLRGLRRELAPGDRLLLGADQVKDPLLLHAAYDDAAGVTAAFNRNVLLRINRELGADFDPEAFRHVVRWNAAESRVEMHLQSVAPQVVQIPALDLRIALQAEETIHTECSYKFTDERIEALFASSGFACLKVWKDPRAWFGVYLATAC